MVELTPESYLERLDAGSIFGRRAPLQVDLGCGDGSFLNALARQTPDHDFLGIERLAGRVRSAARRSAGLSNVRILRVETAYAVRYLVAPGSVSLFHLLFPDPWPKRRHRRRRIFTAEFLEAILAALTPDGGLHIATDQRDYFEEMERLVQESGHLQPAPQNGALSWPVTTFEKRFLAAGEPIYRMVLSKVSPVR